MKASVRKTYLLVLAASSFLTLAATVFRTWLLFTSYDASLGYFASGPAADLLFPLLLVIAAVFYACFGFLARRELDMRDRKPTIPVTFASAFAAVTVAVWMLTHISHVFSAKSPIALVFGLLMILSAAGLLVHFVFSALGSGSKTIRTLAGICAILFCVFYILYAYFDTTFVLNSPIKIFDQLTFAVFALFFIMESRFQFGTAHHAVYLPVTLLAATLSAVNSVPALLYAIKAREALCGNVMHDFMTFALFLYALAQLLAVLEKSEDEDARGAYAEEIEQSTELDYAPDIDTHIVSYDPDQQSFDFDAPVEEDVADDEEPSEDTDGDLDEKDDGDTEDYGIAQTTLDFKRHS